MSGCVLLGLAALFVVCLVLFVWRRHGARALWEEVPRRVAQFASYSARGGILDVRIDRERVLQFGSITEMDREAALQFMLPDTSWTRLWFDEFVSDVEGAGLRCEVELAPAPALPVVRFAHVVLSGDAHSIEAQAQKLLAIFGRLIGIAPRATVRFRSRGGLRQSFVEDLRRNARTARESRANRRGSLE